MTSPANTANRPGANRALISVVIVNYRVPGFLSQALRSLREARLYDRSEVIVVDNASGDNSRAVVTAEFPEIRWIALKHNVGFGAACNIGVRRAAGEYILLLNPDTVVSANTLSELVRCHAEHPDVGIVGPKILNQNGTLQPSCRRSFPTPLISLYHFSGLGRLFPRSRTFGRYNLTYLDPDQPGEVDALSGSCMFLTRKRYREIGGFDETFFMYGEDLDLCGRIREKGLRVWYLPSTSIIHFKGKSAAQRSLESRWEFYKAMMLFSRKYHGRFGTFLPAWLVYVGIVLQAGINIATHIFKTVTACVIDGIVINATLWAALTLRFILGARRYPYNSDQYMGMIAMHLLITFVFIAVFYSRGVYTRARYSVMNTFFSGGWASFIFMAIIYFLDPLAYSRIAFAAAGAALSVLLPLWRELLSVVTGGVRRLVYATGRVLVVGNGPVARRLIANIEDDATAEIYGVIWPEHELAVPEFCGYPVIGTIDELRGIIEREQIDMLVVATADQWYSHIIETLSSQKGRHVAVRWVPRQQFSLEESQIPEVIPLTDFTV